jgi:hypothetical protein
MDDSYRNLKRLTNTIVTKTSVPFGVYNLYNYPQSNHAILNNIRTEFEEFSQYQDKSLVLKKFNNNRNLFLEKPIKLKDKNIKFNNYHRNNYGTSIQVISNKNLKNEQV